ncbi:hypothetical protein JHW43_008986 [Diplocarpon mali]|nr:hypothetical protein JHW43_008986 [Diplocarpon mali]
MDSQALQAIHLKEKPGVPGHDLKPSHGSCIRTACHRRQDAKNIIVIAVGLLIWWSCGIIPTVFEGHGRNLATTGGSGRSGDKHTSFDTVSSPHHELPMDYNRPLNASSNNPKVHIALLLVPGKHKGSRKASTSPLILNPGGPGGPGAAFASVAGPLLQKVVGEEQDIIGFDPRGVGATSPRADCFSYPLAGPDHDDSVGNGEDYIRGNFHRMLWAMAGSGIGNVNSSVDSLEKLDLRARTVAKLCGEKDAVYGSDSILKYSHTPSVARDMLSIVDAWDGWRERIGDSDVEDEEVEGATTESAVSINTKGKLVYWGFSYGTLLGATFAAMFPDRVGRVILGKFLQPSFHKKTADMYEDGVVDADHYVSPVWRGSIGDADKISNSFPYYCHKAKETCALYRAGDQVVDIENRFRDILTRIERTPVTTVHPVSKQPVIITLSQLRMILFGVLYSPNVGFMGVASIFDQLDRGNDDVLAQIFPLPEPEPFCAANIPAEVFPNEAQIAIMCSDKRYPFNDTLPELQNIYEKMAKESSWADVWMTVMIGCNAYPVKAVDPPMRWDDHLSHKADPIKTAFPLLFISNTADPVTPLAAGVKMARKFVDAGLIEQHSMGHCSLAAVSKCTIGKVRDYLARGKLPPHPVKGGKGRELVDGKWDECDADEWPFHPFVGNITVAEYGTKSAIEAQSMDAMKGVQDIFSKMKAWGQGLTLNFDSIVLKPEH